MQMKNTEESSSSPYVNCEHPDKDVKKKDKLEIGRREVV
jgi:hypothetical protein